MTEVEIEVQDQRRVAVDLFNHVWTRVEQSDRSTAEDDDMLHAAHASRWHWGQVGGAQEISVGEWQCSRVYAVLERAEPALHHAHRCLELAGHDDVAAFVVASAYEALARAHIVAGDMDAARAARDESARLTAALEDLEDREVIEGDLATLPF